MEKQKSRLMMKFLLATLWIQQVKSKEKTGKAEGGNR
jgi:hypothetical protein